MNIKVKISFILVVTLIIGIVTGAMLNRAFTQRRIQRVFSMRNPNSFVQSYLDTLNPDTEQRRQIKEILDKHAMLIAELRTKFQEEMSDLFESMRSELEPILSKEQIDQLESNMPMRQFFPGPFSVSQELFFLKKELGLSKEQEAQVKQILEDMRSQMEKRFVERGSFPDWRKSFEELQEKKREAIEEILTEDQKKAYAEVRKKRNNGFRRR